MHGKESSESKQNENSSHNFMFFTPQQSEGNISPGGAYDLHYNIL
jgi:hypothetical protein